jgi:predicted flavoprotein YhiN
MAAGAAAEAGARVVLFEKTARLGNKILISGKTRCNLTNTAPLEEFIGAYGPNGRFLHGPFRRFFRDELLALLGRYGLQTKSERGGRVFPVSDDAADVVAALQRYMAEQGADVRMGAPVSGIETQALDVAISSDHPRRFVAAVRTARGIIPADAVILATGGSSYPKTGSSGDGYRIAAELGHTIVPLRPALVPLIVEETDLAKSMQGVSLRNVRLTAFACRAADIDSALTPGEDRLARQVGPGAGKRPRKPVIESRFGEMMMTHFGIGGPITLLMSLGVVDALAEGPVSVSIDLKPALSEAQLRERLQRDFETHGKRGFRRLLEGLLPQKLIEPFLGLTGIPADKPGHQITAEERERLLGMLKSLRFNVKGPLPMASAIVTAGGVSLKEIDPRTMESRLIEGLYFCGEVMDLDADTGGYNLQAAFTTGYIAGQSAAERVLGLG